MLEFHGDFWHNLSEKNIITKPKDFEDPRHEALITDAGSQPLLNDTDDSDYDDDDELPLAELIPKGTANG